MHRSQSKRDRLSADKLPASVDSVRKNLVANNVNVFRERTPRCFVSNIGSLLGFFDTVNKISVLVGILKVN